MIDWKEIHSDFTPELQKEWEEKEFDYLQTKCWINVVGLGLEDFNFAHWLKKRTYSGNPKWVFDYNNTEELEELRKKYNGEILKKNNVNLDYINAQEWLDKNYPKEKRGWMREVYLNEPSLKGELDLQDFTFYHGIKIYVSFQIDKTKLNFKNLPKKVKVVELINAQKYIDSKYPIKWLRKMIRNLEISEKKLEGDLNLNDFTNLRTFECFRSKLTSLDLTNCEKLELICCKNNFLTNIALPTNSTNLKWLILVNNNFPEQNLSFLTSYTNLESINLGNSVYLENEKHISLHNKEKRKLGDKINQGIYNRWTGSLDYLSGMKKLEYLDISNTNINKVDMNKLPSSLGIFNYSTELRSDCKLTEINSELDKHFGKFGRCSKCGFANTSEEWCQSCKNKEWQLDLKNLTGQELIEKFIQQHQSREREKWNWEWYWAWNKLQWIPYEQFTDIEYLAQGGFGKVYKAQWNGEDWWRKNFLRKNEVALKVLNNSRDLNLEFLQEVANVKLLDDDIEYGAGTDSKHNIARCHGISQDPETENYVIVMQYIDNGNLRQWLQNKDKDWNENWGLNVEKRLDLTLENKLVRLRDITSSLFFIHQQNLVHRDFHSGNILHSGSYYYTFPSKWKFCYITDLGLCQPASYQKKEGEIFGVPPYIAPEVLRGKPYTQKSDIYSFGIIAYEWLASSYPYPKMDDANLAVKICQGLRPDIDSIPIPQLLKDLIKRCWNVDSEKRPSSEELNNVIRGYFRCGTFDSQELKKDTEFYQQYQKIEDVYNYFSLNALYQIHPTATIASKMMDTKKIMRLLKKSERIAASESLDFNIDELDNYLEDYENNEGEFASNQTNWTNLNPNFTEELQKKWQNLNFSYQQTQEWLNIGLTPTDFSFASWLRDVKHLTPIQTLNHHNYEELRAEFQLYQEQLTAHQLQPPKQ